MEELTLTVFTSPPVDGFPAQLIMNATSVFEQQLLKALAACIGGSCAAELAGFRLNVVLDEPDAAAPTEPIPDESAADPPA